MLEYAFMLESFAELSNHWSTKVKDIQWFWHNETVIFQCCLVWTGHTGWKPARKQSMNAIDHIVKCAKKKFFFWWTFKNV